MAEIAFTTRLTESDWDEALRGWRCPPLAVPGAIVEAIYVEGDRIDNSKYEVLPQHALVRWVPPDQPKRAVAAIRLTEALTLGAETDRWKKLAIILPVLATILSAGITAGVTLLRPDRVRLTTNSGVENKPIPPSPRLQDTAARPPHTAAPDPINATMRTAKEISFGETVKGNTSDGERWFKFHVAAKEVDPIRVVVTNLYKTGAANVSVFNGQGIQLGRAFLYLDQDVKIRFQSPQADMYYVALRPEVAQLAAFFGLTVTEQ